jgi:hypothetical protein
LVPAASWLFENDDHLPKKRSFDYISSPSSAIVLEGHYREMQGKMGAPRTRNQTRSINRKIPGGNEMPALEADA